MSTSADAKKIHLTVSKCLYEHLQKIADEHDIISYSEGPKVTATARAMLQLFCPLDKLHGVKKLKEAEDLPLREIIREGVYQRTELGKK